MFTLCLCSIFLRDSFDYDETPVRGVTVPPRPERYAGSLKSFIFDMISESQQLGPGATNLKYWYLNNM